MKQFYVYIHKKPDGTPFYVGKGTGDRAYQFAKRTQWHKNIVAKYGKNNIIVEIVNCLNESQAFDLEKIYIKQFKHDGVCLVNLTDGGEGISGYNHTVEAKKSMSKNRKGKKHTKEHACKIGEKHKGKKISDEHKNILRNAQTGRKHTLEHIQKKAIANTGKKRTEEAKQKIREKALIREASKRLQTQNNVV